MNQWPYVIACYVVTFGGMLALSAVSMIGMRRAEKSADGVGNKRS